MILRKGGKNADSSFPTMTSSLREIRDFQHLGAGSASPVRFGYAVLRKSEFVGHMADCASIQNRSCPDHWIQERGPDARPGCLTKEPMHASPKRLPGGNVVEGFLRKVGVRGPAGEVELQFV